MLATAHCVEYIFCAKVNICCLLLGVAYPEVTVDEELFHSSPLQDIVTSVPLLLLSGSGQEVNLLGLIKKKLLT